MAGKSWGIKIRHRKVLYMRVIERMLAHDAGEWRLHPTVRIARKLSSIQRSFLLAITGACRTTSTAALYAILGITSLHLHLPLDARTSNLYRLRNKIQHIKGSLTQSDWLDYTSLQASSTSPNFTR
ncbi:hypothetical protein AVEN_574-1 [Araneus ventricosus]|uniref:Uncharacterized protein n=1 Tax=Araneus ventricosus TaxID=182803 RepID=A0A4Y2GM59_ARAVE|nr:hypothetical protein AVEN_574-1 [Araneus ventricosus]